MIGLHADHHAIRHSLGTDIAVVDVLDVGFSTLVVINLRVVITLEIMVPHLVELLLNLLIGLAQIGLEWTGVVAREIGTLILIAAGPLQILLFRAEVGTVDIEIARFLSGGQFDVLLRRHIYHPSRRSSIIQRIGQRLCLFKRDIL